MTPKLTHDQVLKQPLLIAKEVMAATSEADIYHIMKEKANQKLLNEKTWFKDISFTLNWIRSKRIELLETSETRLSVTASESSKPSGVKIIDSNDEAQQKSKDKGKGKGKTRTKVASDQSLSPNGYTYKLTNLKVAESPNTPDWRALCHNRVMDMEGTSVLLKEFDKKRVGPMSLRYYTAEAIALDPESVRAYLDESVSWKDGWINVWNASKKRGEDSYNIFKMFANEFAHNPDFSCHDELTYSPDLFKTISGASLKPSELDEYAKSARLEMYGGIRRYYLKERLMKDCISHRLEYLPHDTSVLSVSKSLITQKFNYVTLIDMSGSRNLPRETFLHLITLPHLIGLDVTDTRIDANILFCWMLAMRNGLLSDLRMLCVGGTDIVGGTHILLCCPLLTYLEIEQSIDQLPPFNHQWERRLRLYDRLSRIFGRGQINKANAPHFTRNHFPRSYGIGQKYQELKTLYEELKRYQVAEQANAGYDIIVKPDFGVSYLENKSCIIQEFEFVHDNSDELNQDPIIDLWTDNKKESQFMQEFFRIQHAPSVLETLKMD